MDDRQLITTFLQSIPTEKRKMLGSAVGVRSVVTAVAAIPWGEGRTIQEVLATKGVGTCTGKHLVLQACLDLLDIAYRPVVCTFRWDDQGLVLPENLQALLAVQSWEHGHNFIQLRKGGGEWIDVDITWDIALKPYGFRSFPQEWNGEDSFIGVRLIERWNGVDMSMKKQELMDRLSREQREAREVFLRQFIAWVATLRSED